MKTALEIVHDGLAGGDTRVLPVDVSAELNLPVCVVPEASRRRLSRSEYDQWVNDNLRKLRDPGQRRRLGNQASRQPAVVRFNLTGA